MVLERYDNGSEEIDADVYKNRDHPLTFCFYYPLISKYSELDPLYPISSFVILSKLDKENATYPSNLLLHFCERRRDWVYSYLASGTSSHPQAKVRLEQCETKCMPMEENGCVDRLSIMLLGQIEHSQYVRS